MVHFDVRIPIIVKRVQPETPDYLSVLFERPRGFTFEAGDWMDINLPRNQPPGGTTYSFASSPNEPELQITFRKGVSPFKNVLESLQPGEKLLITEYGNDYDFQLKERQSCVLIAGGVGVAPFRSMLKLMEEYGSNNTAKLIYFNSTDAFLYKAEMDQWQSKLAGLQVHYIVTKELRRKDREKLLYNLLPIPQQQYYVSGPSGMVQSTLKSLNKYGVDSRNIKIDDFGHY